MLKPSADGGTRSIASARYGAALASVMMTMEMDSPLPLPLPALLRNTALEISRLAQEPVSIDVAKLRARCKQLVGELAAALAARNAPGDVARDALYMQCGLLDEAVLAHLPPESRPQWGAFPLQVERFNQHDAGEHVFERLALRMHETPFNAELLACYATVLGLGFKGRYARDGDAQCSAIMRTLNAFLATQGPTEDEALVVNTTRARGLDWLYRLSPWVIAVLASTACAILFMLIALGLAAPVSQLLTAKT
jgi:type VI secretion system protein ImpK